MTEISTVYTNNDSSYNSRVNATDCASINNFVYSGCAKNNSVVCSYDSKNNCVMSADVSDGIASTDMTIVQAPSCYINTDINYKNDILFDDKNCSRDVAKARILDIKNEMLPKLVDVDLPNQYSSDETSISICMSARCSDVVEHNLLSVEPFQDVIKQDDKLNVSEIEMSNIVDAKHFVYNIRPLIAICDYSQMTRQAELNSSRTFAKFVDARDAVFDLNFAFVLLCLIIILLRDDMICVFLIIPVMARIIRVGSMVGREIWKEL